MTYLVSVGLNESQAWFVYVVLAVVRICCSKKRLWAIVCSWVMVFDIFIGESVLLEG